jgi:hypothetical protein
LRGNELSLTTFVNGVPSLTIRTSYSRRAFPRTSFNRSIFSQVVFPAEFGNRFGGILDIVTRNGFDSNGHGSVTFGGGDYLRNNVSFDYGGHTKHFGYFVYGQGFESDRFLNTPEPVRFHDTGKGARSFAQLDYRPKFK